MEFRQLRYFIAVAEDGNIGSAARRLNVSQPPISRQIQALELELDVKLLKRTAKGVELTAAGSAFLEHARKILAQAERAAEQSQAADRGDIGRLNVAFFGSLVYHTVPSALRAFQQTHPNSDISILRMNKDEQIRALREDRVHIAFGRYYSAEPGMKVEKLGEEPAFVAVSAHTRVNFATEVSLAELKDRPIILFPSTGRPSFADTVVSAYRAAGVEPKIEHIAEDILSAIALTGLGSACCIVPGSVAALKFPDLKFYPLADPALRPPINCVYREQGTPPILEAFLSTLRSNAVRHQLITKNV